MTPSLTLPHNEAYYIANGDGVLQSDARAVATAAGYDYTRYILDAVNWSGGPGNYNGAGWVGQRGVWLKSTLPSIAEHEFGHNLGLMHSNLWAATNNTASGTGSNQEYGDRFDVMGSGGGHYNAYWKNFLSWIPNANVTTVQGNGTYRLYSFDSTFAGANSYALKVAKDSSRDYWIDFRQGFYTSNQWLMNGVELHWGPYADSSGSLLLDTTPSSAHGIDDSAVVIGRTYSDYAADIHITPIGKGGTSPESIDVVINRGTWATDHPPVLTLTASATFAPANIPINFIATASDADGDALSYYWDFGNGSFGTNTPAITNAWPGSGAYAVRCTVSDMKGGTASQTIVITVGSRQISGMAQDGSGAPIAHVTVNNGLSHTDGNYRQTLTDSSGNYTLVNLGNVSYTIGASKKDWSFVSSSSNPITPSASGINLIGTPMNHTTLDMGVTSNGNPNGNKQSLSLTASATSVLLNVAVKITAVAIDPASGAVVYNWDLGNGTAVTNIATVNKSWTSAGDYVVRCSFSDSKGGRASKSIVITVVPPQIGGFVQDAAGNPVADAIVSNGLSPVDANYRVALSDSTGSYILTGAGSRSVTMAAAKENWTFTASFVNPVKPSAMNIDFIGVTVLDSPAITSAPQVSQPAWAGQAVTLTVAAFSPQGAQLSYKWDFGDGATGSGASVTHVFAVTGVYNVNVSVSDGGNPIMAAATVTITAPGNLGANQSLANGFNVSKASIKFNFKNAGKDNAVLSGTIALEDKCNPAGKTIVFGLGETKYSYTLDSKGKAGDSNHSFKLTGRMTKGAFTTTTAKFTLTVKNESLFSSMKTLGFCNQNVAMPGTQIEVPVLISINSVTYQNLAGVTYVATAGKSGVAKK